MIKTAILGSSGHIGKNLVLHLSSVKDFELSLYVRSVEKMQGLINLMGLSDQNIKIFNIEDFVSHDIDVILNATGIGNSAAIALEPFNIFKITEYYDDKILDYLTLHHETLYINFSSGVVYGRDFTEPANDSTTLTLMVNKLAKENSYAVAKITSEVKHRCLNDLNIVDIRVFNFYSHFADLNYKYLINDMINCVKNKKVLITNKINTVRDFIHPEDLATMIKLIIKKRKINMALDAYSKAPLSKMELLSFFKEKYGLEHTFSDNVATSITGLKIKYYSENKTAGKELGYEPVYSSLQTIAQEVIQTLE